MNLTHLILPAIISLTLFAQDELAPRLARAQGLSLEQVRDLQARLAAAPAPPDQKAYQEAYLQFCISNLIGQKDSKEAIAILDRTIKTLEAKKDAESLALRGACIGRKIGYSPMSGITQGSKAMGLFREAEKLSPNNPRVLVFKGLSVGHTPAFFGGGVAKALPIFEAAVQGACAEVAPKDPWAPRWGKVESLALLTMIRVELGKLPEAEASLAWAVGLDAEHSLVKDAAGAVARAKKSKN